VICTFSHSGQTLLNQRLLPSVAHSWNQLHLLVFTSPYNDMDRNRGGDKKNVTFNMEVQILGGYSYLITIFVELSVIEQLTDKEQVWRNTYYRTGSKCYEATMGRKWTQYHL